MYYAQHSEIPSFYTFDEIEYSKLDVAQIARHIIESGMNYLEQTKYLNELWEQGDENLLRLFFGGRRCDGHLGGIARGSVGVLHVNRIRSMIHVSTILVCQCDARRAIRWCFVSGPRAQALFDLR